MIKIGTRKSKLALTQAGLVQNALKNVDPTISTTLVPIITTGDQITDRPLADIGGKSLFTKEIDRALQEKRIDIAVHSFKDIDSHIAHGLEVNCVLPREDPRDVLISSQYATLDDLPPKAVIGSSSPRRIAQLLALRPDLTIKNIRGNVDSRINKIHLGAYDATLLAAAGLKRLALTDAISEYLPTHTFLPAASQGIIAIASRIGDQNITDLLSAINHTDSLLISQCERQFVITLAGNCNSPIGALATIKNNHITLDGFVASIDGKTTLRQSKTMPLSQAKKLGSTLATDILNQGGETLLHG